LEIAFFYPVYRWDDHVFREGEARGFKPLRISSGESEEDLAGLGFDAI